MKRSPQKTFAEDTSEIRGSVSEAEGVLKSTQSQTGNILKLSIKNSLTHFVENPRPKAPPSVSHHPLLYVYTIHSPLGNFNYICASQEIFYDGGNAKLQLPCFNNSRTPEGENLYFKRILGRKYSKMQSIG